jgi:hypothetical protein
MQPKTAIAMKSTPQFLHCHCLIAAALILTATLSSGRAQGSKSARPLDQPVVAPVQQNQPPAYNLKIVDETSLGDVIELLREKWNLDVSFVLEPGLGRLTISELKIHSLNVEQTLQAIQVASGGKFTWRNNTSPAGAVYFLTSIQPTKSNVQVEAFNLSGYFTFATSGSTNLEKRVAQEIDQIIVLIESTLKQFISYREEQTGAAPSVKTPSLRFHRGANLLVVMGEPEAVAVVAKVIQALPGVQPKFMPADPFQSTAAPGTVSRYSSDFRGATTTAQPGRAGTEYPPSQDQLAPAPGGTPVYSQPARYRGEEPRDAGTPAAQH